MGYGADVREWCGSWIGGRMQDGHCRDHGVEMETGTPRIMVSMVG